MSTDPEIRLVDTFEDKHPELFRLARHLALAPRTEQRLLRGIRLRFHPELDARHEHILWFSDLVSIRNRSHIIFSTTTAKALTRNTTSEDVADVWSEIRELTRHWQPLDRLERDLHFFTVTQNDSQLRLVFLDLLKLISEYAEEPAKHRQAVLDLSRRIKFNTRLLKDKIGKSEEGSQLINFAANSLLDVGSWSELAAPMTVPDWMLPALPKRTAGRLGVETYLLPDHSMWAVKFIEPIVNTEAIEFYSPLPGRLQITSGQQSFWVNADLGIHFEIDSGPTEVTLTTRHGIQYKLDLVANGSTGNADLPEVELYLAHTADDTELAETLQARLKKQDVIVKLLNETDLDSLTGNYVTNIKVLRLLTQSMQNQWQRRKDQDTVTSHSSMILRADDAEPPSDFSLAGPIVDIRDWIQQRKQQISDESLKQITDWISDETALESAAEEASRFIAWISWPPDKFGKWPEMVRKQLNAIGLPYTDRQSYSQQKHIADDALDRSLVQTDLLILLHPLQNDPLNKGDPRVEEVQAARNYLLPVLHIAENRKDVPRALYQENESFFELSGENELSIDNLGRYVNHWQRNLEQERKNQRIFISHIKEDAAFARVLRQSLALEGW
ncbi:MAG: hypothetical protein QNK24_08030, partial [Desulfuromusa sp.]|nr:hypothetical protein [Desulfuromusa sp.]